MSLVLFFDAHMLSNIIYLSSGPIPTYGHNQGPRFSRFLLFFAIKNLRLIYEGRVQYFAAIRAIIFF